MLHTYIYVFHVLGVYLQWRKLTICILKKSSAQTLDCQAGIYYLLSTQSLIEEGNYNT